MDSFLNGQFKKVGPMLKGFRMCTACDILHPYTLDSAQEKLPQNSL